MIARFVRNFDFQRFGGSRAWLGSLVAASVVAGFGFSSGFTPAEAASRTEKTFSGWTVACVENDQNVKRCSLRQTLTRKDRRPVFTWTISTNQEGELIQVVSVPAGVSIKEGIRIFVGDGDPLTLGYDICGPRACFARADLSPEVVATMKGTSKAAASYVLANKQLLQFDLAAEGFAEAYDYLIQQLDT